MFDTRADALELLDREEMDETFAIRSYRFMSVVNKFFGGTAIVKDFIENEIKTRNNAEPLKILDIGSGACDIPAAICSWANTAGINVEFTCIETNPYAIKIGKDNIRSYPNIKLLQEDIFSYQPSEKYDCSMGSLFFHHLTDEQIIELISKLRTFGCRSILINDLHRSLRCFGGCILATLLTSTDVRHDALLSIRRAFKPRELYELIKRVSQTRASVRTAWFGRVCTIVRFEMEDGR